MGAIQIRLRDVLLRMVIGSKSLVIIFSLVKALTLHA